MNARSIKVLVGIALGVVLAWSAMAAIVKRALRIATHRMSSISESFESVASHSGVVWDGLTPRARSWLANSRCHDFRGCTVADVDVNSVELYVQCRSALLRFGFQYKCENAMSNIAQSLKLGSCDRDPRLVHIAVRESGSSWRTVLSEGEPID